MIATPAEFAAKVDRANAQGISLDLPTKLSKSIEVINPVHSALSHDL
jgi:hypothetical protein